MLYNEKIGELKHDNLFASMDVKPIVQAIEITEDYLTRGTIIATDGTALAAGKVPFGVLCCDAILDPGPMPYEVYVTGHFNKDALIVAEGHTLTAEQIKALRDGGIFIENAVK